MAFFESIEVEGMAADGRRIRARAVLEDGDDPLTVCEGLRCWVDDELRRWLKESQRAETRAGDGTRVLRVSRRIPLPFQEES